MLSSNVFNNSSIQKQQEKCKSLQDIVIEIVLGGKNSVQSPLLLKLLFLLTLKQCLHWVRSRSFYTFLCGNKKCGDTTKPEATGAKWVVLVQYEQIKIINEVK